ncbi:MAG: large conductance mechanosensitive channel protein MscL [Actinobacteria bacterium]|nr:large conductance mechanosensitive channel protein MscL [Actinomycetota bacterium]
MWKEFKNFIMKGSVVDLAIGIIIGVAFSAIVSSLVNDIIMPPIGLALGKVDFLNLFMVLKEGNTPGPYISLAAAKEAGAVTLNYGIFVNAIITFIIIAIVLFFIIKAINSSKKKEAAATKPCSYCFTTIDIKATRCPNCTSELKVTP